MNNSNQSSVIGMIGLGVMGRNLLLNMADHGFAVSGFDMDQKKVDLLRQESKEQAVFAANDIHSFIDSLAQPRTIMLLVPAGPAVDAVVQELLPFLTPGDLIIDAGNSYFKDTDQRINHLQAKNIHFMGIGISGGEEGARRGPSIMPGGIQSEYDRIAPILKAVSAKVNNEPCVTYLGATSAGHFVKMVHNGIEYAIMELIAETYDVMKHGLGVSNQQLHEIYTRWNSGKLNSYLMEITAQIFNTKDDKTNKLLIDSIKAIAKQNGTGMWTSKSGMELQVPTPTIDVSVGIRDLSVLAKEREQASIMYERSAHRLEGDQKSFIEQLEEALLAAIMIAYAQGMALLSVASEKYQYHLNLEKVAKIWRGGCIIRSALLDDIAHAYQCRNDLSNLLFDPGFSNILQEKQESLRQVVAKIALLGIPAPAMMASLGYFDTFRSRDLPANLIQAQRDYFGSHLYERIDMPGVFHTKWEK